MGMLKARRVKKQTSIMVNVIGYFLLTLSKGSRLRKPMKCL
jgi:hypothetical protein